MCGVLVGCRGLFGFGRLWNLGVVVFWVGVEFCLGVWWLLKCGRFGSLVALEVRGLLKSGGTGF